MPVAAVALDVAEVFEGWAGRIQKNSLNVLPSVIVGDQFPAGIAAMFLLSMCQLDWYISARGTELLEQMAQHQKNCLRGVKENAFKAWHFSFRETCLQSSAP